MDGKFTGFGTASLVLPSGATRVRPCTWSGVRPGNTRSILPDTDDGRKPAAHLRPCKQRHWAAHSRRLRAAGQAAGRRAGERAPVLAIAEHGGQPRRPLQAEGGRCVSRTLPQPTTLA